MQSRYIHVEGRVDALIVDLILSRLFGNHPFLIQPAQANLHPRSLRKMSEAANVRQLGGIVVYDQDEGTLGDIPSLKSLEEFPNIILCPTIPTTEAWILADVDWASNTFGLTVDEILLGQRYGKPSFRNGLETIVKDLIRKRSADFHHAFRNFNIEQAAANSPSLRYFIETASRQIEQDVHLRNTPDVLTPKVDRNVIACLIAEVQPTDAPLFQTLGKTYTAAEMRNEVIEGTEVGVSYIANVLRVARDILRFDAEEASNEDAE